MTNRFALAALAIVFVGGRTLGQTDTGSPDVARAIARRIESPDRSNASAAIAEIRESLSNDTGRRAIPYLHSIWLPSMLSSARFADAAELSLRGLLVAPNLNADQLMPLRIDALLAMGDTAAALQASKSFYNNCSMRNTRWAIQSVARCLAAARPSDPAAPIRFKLQQAEAAMPTAATATQPARSTSDEPNVLATITVDPKPYEQAISFWSSQDGFEAMVCLGNTYLMADEPTKAMEVLKRAYAMATDDQIATASEAIARAMRAEDGNVGRANAWVLSIRPKESPATAPSDR